MSAVPASRVRRERLADCPFSAAEEYVCAFLREAKRCGGRFALRGGLGSLALRRQVRFHYALRPDLDERGRPHDEVALRWSSGSWLLPDFEGAIRLRIAALRTVVRIEGSYRPPLGPLGALFDAVLGRSIARATLDDLLARLCAELEGREREWRRGQGAA